MGLIGVRKTFQLYKRATGGDWAGLDFTTGSTPGEITASGAANGTRINSSGTLVSGTAPRLDYNPVSPFASYGIKCEPARTNSILYSNDLASWTNTRSSETQDVTGPDGNTSAWTLTADGTSGIHTVHQDLTISASTNYALSVYAKAGTGTFPYISISSATVQNNVTQVFDLSDGSVGSSDVGSSSGTLTSSAITDAGGGFYRLQLVGSIGLTTARIYLGISNSKTPSFSTAGAVSSTSTDTIVFFGVQLEEGTYASSYVATTTGTVTRTAESLKFTPPAGVTDIRFTYQDDTTGDATVTPEVEYTIPTGQKGIKTITDITA